MCVIKTVILTLSADDRVQTAADEIKPMFHETWVSQQCQGSLSVTAGPSRRHQTALQTPTVQLLITTFNHIDTMLEGVRAKHTTNARNVYS